jgi:para-nitrobenzyl esterase
MSEDCLQVNVWAPKGRGPHPVLVWIYGGGNDTGASALPVYQGDTFARDGIVFVSFNYRLGVFGFLELGEIIGPEARGSGNNAIRDQLLALQWVRDNVASFGGDPRNITIAGQSSGAASVAALLSLPLATGFVQRAIIASGNASVANSMERASKFARVFVRQLGGAARLYGGSTEELIRAQQLAKAEFKELLPFRPVIDGQFLADLPIKRWQAGAARRVQLLLGHTEDEYRYFISPSQIAGPLRSEMLLSTMGTIEPILAGYRQAYPDLSEGERALKILSAEAFNIPAIGMAEAQSASGGRTHYYVLRYPVPGGPYGVSTPHGSDVPLIFDKVDTDFARRVFGYSALRDSPMAAHLHGIWNSFVKTGVPKLDALTWPPYDTQRRATMVVSRNAGVTDDLESTERRIWERLS